MDTISTTHILIKREEADTPIHAVCIHDRDLLLRTATQADSWEHRQIFVCNDGDATRAWGQAILFEAHQQLFVGTCICQDAAKQILTDILKRKGWAEIEHLPGEPLTLETSGNCAWFYPGQLIGILTGPSGDRIGSFDVNEALKLKR